MQPLKFIRELFSGKTINGFIEQLYNPDESDELKAFSAAFGIFMGIIPIWGFQTPTAIFFALVLKLNKALVIIFSQVSFPLFFPLIIFLSYKAGGYWVGSNTAEISFSRKSSFISTHLEQYIYGSFTLGIAAAVTIGLLTFAWLKLIKILKQYRLTAKLKKV